MTGIIKTDQLQGAQSSTITVPSGNNLTVGGTLGVTGDVTATNTSGNRTLGIITGTSNSSILNMGDTDAANVGQVKYHHGINSMVLRTNGSDKVTLDSTGNLLFNAASTGVYLGVTSANAANLLDDYEEGTWTPTIIGYSGGNTQTYSTQAGNYTKVGRLITAHYSVRLSAKGNISGNYVHLTGMPFAHLATTGGSGIIHYVWSIGTARDNLGWELGGGTTDRSWLTYLDGTTTGYVNTSDLGNSTGFAGTLIYTTS